jgi:transcriptional regulator with PAS, ATPase and Fis domain
VKIPVVSQCDVNVLISGETGTGKELFARAIHYLSPRASKPFIPVSCGAIPLELIENELFGHVKGAFTGASSPQPGLLQEAHGGTLFLDEIDCLPMLAQVKFLRFLQEREYKQLGSPKVHHADVRVIGATNVELEKAVQEGKFRQDLYYRVNIIPLVLPPLRERKGDIPLLARYFLEKYAVEFDKGTKEFAGEALQKLVTYEWPGNVRELENVVERAVVFSKESIIHQVDILSPSSDRLQLESFRTAKARMIGQFEKNYIENVLCAHRGNISKAAEAVQKNRRAFWELIRKYRIDVHRFKFG